MGSRGSVIPYFQKLCNENASFFPITHEDMTRFNITLSQGVDLVLWAINNALGGEIIVPKIPSYRILDVADAINPDIEKRVVGIRPGEKLHEEMITVSDGPLTLDCEDKYLIMHPDLIDNYPAENYLKKVEYGFSYNSGLNSDFLNVHEIKKLIEVNI